MATWTEVQERARTEYVLDVDKRNELALTIQRQEGVTTRAQRVMVRHYSAWGREMAEMRSAFGEWGDYDTAGLLADNLNLPLGAVALHGRFLVLVHKVCLDDTTVDGVMFLLTRMSLLADVLEQRKGTDKF